MYYTDSNTDSKASSDDDSKPSFIKWVDFNADYQILDKLYALDKKYHGSDIDFNFIDALAYLSTKNGNKFSSKTDTKNLNQLVSRLQKKELACIKDAYPNNKYFLYYQNAYRAIFAEFFGEYSDGQEQGYGLIAYSPIASGYWFSHYDDFGNGRSFGFKRKHLGHDLFGSVGTPIIATEGGTIQEIGWNRYGGWRIGIRSFDKKRYYYYAHLRKNKPFASGLLAGQSVEAGQVIGYMGATGYSNKPNTNMDSKPHLHFGLQLIFDKSQENGNGEIWIDLYSLTKFLEKNKAKVKKENNSNEYYSINQKRKILL